MTCFSIIQKWNLNQIWKKKLGLHQTQLNFKVRIFFLFIIDLLIINFIFQLINNRIQSQLTPISDIASAFVCSPSFATRPSAIIFDTSGETHTTNKTPFSSFPLLLFLSRFDTTTMKTYPYSHNKVDYNKNNKTLLMHCSDQWAPVKQEKLDVEAICIDPFRLFFNVLQQAKLKYCLTCSRYQYSSLFLTIS